MRAETKAHPDEFDELLIRLRPTLREDAEKSLRIAEDEMCRKFLLQDEDNPGLCHLDVIPGNFVYTQDKEVFVLDLDLATFSRRACWTWRTYFAAVSRCCIGNRTSRTRVSSATTRFAR